MSSFERDLEKALGRAMKGSIPTSDYSLNPTFKEGSIQYPKAPTRPQFTPVNSGMKRDWSGSKMSTMPFTSLNNLANKTQKFANSARFYPKDTPLDLDELDSLNQTIYPILGGGATGVPANGMPNNPAPQPANPINLNPPVQPNPAPQPNQPTNPNAPAPRTRRDGTLIKPFPKFDLEDSAPTPAGLPRRQVIKRPLGGTAQEQPVESKLGRRLTQPTTRPLTRTLGRGEGPVTARRSRESIASAVADAMSRSLGQGDTTEDQSSGNVGDMSKPLTKSLTKPLTKTIPSEARQTPSSSAGGRKPSKKRNRYGS